MVDIDGHLSGRITAEDAIAKLRGEADHQLMTMACLVEEDDLLAPVISVHLEIV